MQLEYRQGYSRKKCNSGFAYNPPARRVQMVLNDYMRVSSDFLPYAFYSSSKTSVFAVTHAAEAPVTKIRLNAYDGYCFYKKVSSQHLRFHLHQNPRQAKYFSSIFMYKS